MPHGSARVCRPDGAPDDRLGGSNLTVGFCDVLKHVDAEEQEIPTPAYRYVPFNGNSQGPGGLRANWRYATYSDRREDFGKCLTKMARASRSCRLTDRDGKVVIEESYEFAGDDGGFISVRLEYERAAPRHWVSPGDGMHVRCPAEPDIEFVYQNEEWRDLVLHRQDAIDRTRSLEYRIEVPGFGDLFDGSEELVSVAAVPWSVRQVFSVRVGA